MTRLRIRNGHSNPRSGVRGVWFWLLATICLTGCSAWTPAASMRVDVEVYKGPLVKTKEAQWGELEGVIAEAETSLEKYQKGVADFVVYKLKPARGVGPATGDIAATACYCRNLTSEPWSGRWHFSKNRDRFVVASACDLFDNAGRLKDALRALEAPAEVKNAAKTSASSSGASLCAEAPDVAKEIKSESANTEQQKLFLKEAVKVAAQLKARSAAVGASFIPMVTDRNVLRSFQALLAGTTSEYGNLIGSRASVLMLQLDGKKREKLPLSAYLMDSGPTETMNVYDWYNAKSPGILEEWDWFLPGTSVDMTSRVRAYEKLFSDIYWSKVNTVYASGVGEVNMAFVRDEIGNWNLKNFSSDPTDLLAAYKNMTLAGISTATSIIDKAKDAGALQAALQVAQQITIAPQTTNKASVQKQVDKLHDLTAQALLELEQEYAGKAECKGKEESCLNEAIQRAEKILEYHGQLMDALQALSSSS